MTVTLTAAPRISPWFASAALLSLLTAGIHVLAGTPEIMAPLLAAPLPPAVLGVADVMWHHITWLLIGGAAASAAAACRPGWREPVAVLLGGQFIIIAALFLVLGAVWFGSAWPMPQWVLFGLMAMLMLVGWRRGAGNR